MKYLYFLPLILLISACNRTKYVEFTIDVPGINNGAIVIKDASGNYILTGTITGGKFYAKKILPKAGFYDMYITPDIEKDYKKKIYDIYAEPGNYSVTAGADKLYLYPVIKTASKIQNELSEYYTAATEKMHDADVNVKNITALMGDKNSPAMAGGSAGLQDQLTTAIAAFNKVQAQVLEDYVTREPKNEVAAHILSELDYKKDPVSCYAIYKKFSAAQKATPEGKTEGDDLAYLAKLAPGALAPDLAGTTPDGKSFNFKVLKKKIILVEFWRSDNAASKYNHRQLTDGYYTPLKNKNFTVVSVSLDTTKSTWVNGIQADKLTWTQLSDLKGTASPNMTNWAVSTIPTYDLLDDNWHFIKRDIDFTGISDEMAKYLKTSVLNR